MVEGGSRIGRSPEKSGDGISLGPEILLSLVLPAYNESRQIGDTLQKTIAYLAPKPYAWELIVVDDGSTDNTSAAAREAIEHRTNVQVISNTQNRGKGHALKTGMLATRGQYAGFMDADGKTDIGCIEDALGKLNANWDVVIGSRTAAGTQIQAQPKRYRRIASRVFNRYIRLMVPVLNRYRDTQCGFKFFQQNAAREIFSRLVVERFMFDVEVLFLAHSLKYRICEIPVKWSTNPDTRTTFIESVVRNSIDLFRIRKAHRDL